MKSRPGLVSRILGSLIILDSVLALVAFFGPSFWFSLFHGAPYMDPEGLLRRSGAQWLAFALFQGLALLSWKKSPFWLAMVAGLRWGDLFTDLVYYIACQHITFLGSGLLLVAGPCNLLLGFFFWAQFAAVSRSRSLT